MKVYHQPSVRVEAKRHSETFLMNEVTTNLPAHFLHTAPLSKFLQTRGMDILTAQGLVEGTASNTSRELKEQLMGL